VGDEGEWWKGRIQLWYIWHILRTMQMLQYTPPKTTTKTFFKKHFNPISVLCFAIWPFGSSGIAFKIQAVYGSVSPLMQS
jgi:hypothetical protein